MENVLLRSQLVNELKDIQLQISCLEYNIHRYNDQIDFVESVFLDKSDRSYLADARFDRAEIKMIREETGIERDTCESTLDYCNKLIAFQSNIVNQLDSLIDQVFTMICENQEKAIRLIELSGYKYQDGTIDGYDEPIPTYGQYDEKNLIPVAINLPMRL